MTDPTTQKCLLTVLAHPDDESFGPGGTLGRYAAEGTAVHIAIATDGAAGSVAAGYEEARQRLVEVRAEELKAAVNVLGGTLHTLGYRDSGMGGTADNDDPKAFINADEEEAVGKVVRLIRTHRPQVVMTHDETGGYFHPDHIQCWKITTAAFHAAGDPEKYPEIGPAPYQPARLYYTAFPKRWVTWRIWLLRLRGEDPTQVGRNKDIDLTKLGVPSEKIHAYIGIRDAWETKKLAGAEHASQGGGTSMNRLMPEWLSKLIFGREMFMRAYPRVPNGFIEHDLFP